MRSAYHAALVAAAIAPSAGDLAMRDPARAASFGLFGSQPSFGGESEGGASSGASFGADWFEPGDEGQWNAADMGDPRFARQQLARGDDREIGVNRDAFRNLVGQRNDYRSDDRSLQARLERLEDRLRGRYSKTQARRELIDPNEGSGIDVGRLMFPISQTIPVLGTAYTFTNFFGQPDTTIKPERIAMNAPAYGFVLVQDIKVKNVSAIIGGSTDAAFFSGTAVGMHVSLPKLTPSNKLTVYAAYTNAIPAGYAIGPYPFVVQAIGPALVTGSDRVEDD